jgi:hypothetical protein
VTDSLQINFGDVDDMRAKLPRAREILERKDAEVQRVQRSADFWRRLVETLESQVPDAEGDISESESADRPDHTEGQISDHAPSDVLELVVGVVNTEGRPIRALEVAKILRGRGHRLENATVSNSLHYAAKRAKPARVRKLPARGVYAPLDALPPALQPTGESNGNRSSLITEPLAPGSQEMASAAGAQPPPNQESKPWGWSDDRSPREES